MSGYHSITIQLPCPVDPSDGKPFTKHHQSSQRQSLSASLSVLSIASKIPEKSLIVNSVPYVGTILLPKLSAVLTQGP